MLRKVGLAILLAGAVLLLVAGLYLFFAAFLPDPKIPWLIKLPVALVIVGLLVLMISVIVERIRQKDRYREVER